MGVELEPDIWPFYSTNQYYKITKYQPRTPAVQEVTLKKLQFFGLFLAQMASRPPVQPNKIRWGWRWVVIFGQKLNSYQYIKITKYQQQTRSGYEVRKKKWPILVTFRENGQNFEVWRAIKTDRDGIGAWYLDMFLEVISTTKL